MKFLQIVMPNLYVQFDQNCWKLQVRVGGGTSGRESRGPCIALYGLESSFKYHLHFLGHIQILHVVIYLMFFFKVTHSLTEISL